jgi:hypothetical protein
LSAPPGSLAFLASDKLKLTLMHDWAYIEPMAPRESRDEPLGYSRGL